MIPISRRLLLGTAGAGLVASPMPVRAAAPVEVFSTAFPPLTVDDPARPGFANAVTLDLLRMVGRPARLTYLPWPEALRRAREERGRLVTPPARTEERERLFTWVAKVMDLTSSFVARDASHDVDSARRIARLAVLRGSGHAASLHRLDFPNLVEMDDLASMLRAVLDGRADAAYGLTEDIRASLRRLGRASELRLGPPLAPTGMYLAAGLDTGDLPVADLRAAFAALEQDGTVETHDRAYFEGGGGRGG